MWCNHTVSGKAQKSFLLHYIFLYFLMLLQLIVGLALDMSGQVSWTKAIWIFPHESWENTRLKIEIVLVLAHLHFEVIWSKIPSLAIFFFQVLLTLFKLSSKSSICNLRPNRNIAFLTKINSWSSWGPKITLVNWRFINKMVKDWAAFTTSF